MNNKKYDLKKVSKVAVATLFLLFLLVDFLAWPQIGSSTSGIVTAFVFEVAVLLALALYGVHMVNREKKGLTTAGGSFIQTLAKYEFLMEQLISRDFKIKYKRSVLGVFWSFLNPLLMMTVQYVVFSKLLGVRDAGVHLVGSPSSCSTSDGRKYLGSTSTKDFPVATSIPFSYWDDEKEPSVECPVGDFFCSAYNEYAQLSSLAVCVNHFKPFISL